MKLLTLAEIAKEIDVPESTVRFYRDKFDDFIPSVGKGRSKRYKVEALDVLRFIAEGFKRNETATMIQERLSIEFARTVSVGNEPQPQTAAEQQSAIALSESVVGMMNSQNLALQQMAAAVQMMADQSKRIDELENEIKVLKKNQQQPIKSWFKMLLGK